MELRHPQNKRTKCFSSVPAQVYRVFEEEDTRLTRLGDSISSVLRKELGSRITGRTNLMVRQTFENQQEAAGIWMGFWSFFFWGMAIKVIVWSHEEYQWMIFHEIGWGDDTTHNLMYVMI